MVVRIESGRLATVAVLTAIALGVGCSNESPCGPGYKTPHLPASNAGKVTISQGLWGDVWFFQGNFRPMCPTGTISGVAREMRIHELTGRDQVEGVYLDGVLFYTAIHAPLVATAHSDETGFFQVELPPGSYSLFAVEGSLFYANGFDGSGHIWPAVVKEGQVTQVRFDINYKAWF
jgi:hypothetical protein